VLRNLDLRFGLECQRAAVSVRARLCFLQELAFEKLTSVGSRKSENGDRACVFEGAGNNWREPAMAA